MSATLKNVLIVGATGNLGRVIAEGFLSDKRFNTFILTRKGAQEDEKKGPILKSLVSKGAQLRVGDIAAAPAELATALAGIDVVLSAHSGANLISDQLNLLAAAVKAGVKRFVPSDFIGDLTKHKVGTQPFWDGKVSVRDAIKASGLEYTFINTSGIAEFIFGPFLSFDPIGHKAEVVGDGNWRTSVITLADLGRFIPAVIAHPDSRNANINIQSDAVTWNQAISAFEEAAGVKFERQQVSLDAQRKLVGELAAEMAKNPANFFGWYAANLKLVFATDEAVHHLENPFNVTHPEINGGVPPTSVKAFAKQYYANHHGK